MVKMIKKNFLEIGLILITIFTALLYPHINTVYKVSDTNIFPVGPIISGSDYIQETVFDEEFTANGVYLYVATYGRENTNENCIQVYIDNRLIVSEIINSKEIEDNSFIYVYFDELEIEEGDSMKLVLSSEDGTPENCITVWLNGESAMNTSYYGNYEEGNYLLQNGSGVSGLVSCKSIYETIQEFYNYSIFLQLMVLLSVIVAVSLVCLLMMRILKKTIVMIRE